MFFAIELHDALDFFTVTDVIGSRRTATFMQATSTREALDPEGMETRVLHGLVRLAGRDVLEIGSGDGRLTWRYAERAASVVGLEPEESHVLRAKAAMPAPLRNRIDFRVADAASVELPDAAFDVVVLAWSI